MHFLTGFGCLVTFIATTTRARYVLVEDYFADGNFFDRFTFWGLPDPTNGFVQYQPYDAAKDWLVRSQTDNARMMVDSRGTAARGRPSVRITSRKSYQFGLVVVDIDHMPGGACGTWPAFWMVGPDWPNEGEIDIIEGVNDQQTNDMTLHTGPGCSISRGDAPISGTIDSTDCTSDSADNEGCKITTNDTRTYGSGFNAIGAASSPPNGLARPYRSSSSPADRCLLTSPAAHPILPRGVSPWRDSREIVTWRPRSDICASSSTRLPAATGRVKYGRAAPAHRRPNRRAKTSSRTIRMPSSMLTGRSTPSKCTR